MKKDAADFKGIARNALQGKWPTAILAGYVASLLGAATASSDVSFYRSNDSTKALFQEMQTPEVWAQIRTFVIIALAILVVSMLISLIIGGAVKLGYAVFNLKLVDRKKVSLSDLFSQFHRFGAGFCMNFLTQLYTFLWSLLFVIPGIVKSLSYAMAPYILAEHPEMTAGGAIKESQRMMNGNKLRLVGLNLSFCGWVLLYVAPLLVGMWIMTWSVIQSGNWRIFLWLIPCVLLVRIGSVFLAPYRETALAAFYREVFGTETDL